MSARNGDKARFGKQRKRKMAHRARTQVLREGLKAPVAAVPLEHVQSEQPATDDAHSVPGALGSAAGVLGSAIGALAAKVKGVKEPEPAHAD